MLKSLLYSIMSVYHLIRLMVTHKIVKVQGRCPYCKSEYAIERMKRSGVLKKYQVPVKKYYCNTCRKSFYTKKNEDKTFFVRYW
jgi:transposase-like protein